MSFKRNVYTFLSVSDNRRDLSWYFDITLITLIILNVVAIILESVPSISEKYGPQFEFFELFSVIFFSIEYILRVWSITEDPEYSHPFWGRLRYIISPMALVDLLAILPFYAALSGRMTSMIDARFLRALRMFRLLRLFKIVRYVRALRIIVDVFRNKKEELLISLSFILFMLLLVSCGMYYVEKDEPGTQFTSIPATMWWGVATLTTVGYGDIYPVTALGKLLGGIIAILGIGLFALPTGILAAGCSAEIEKHRKVSDEAKFCSHCGKPLSEH